MKFGVNNLKFKKYHIKFLNPNRINFNKFKFYFGNIAIQALESGKLLASNIEATRKVIRRTLKKKVPIKIHVYPYEPVTKKPVSVRMGKGKGSHSHWVAPIEKGQILYEIKSDNLKLLKKIYKKAYKKLPIKTKPLFFYY